MSQQPNRLPPEWLAGYVDGELSAAERAQVERCLAEQPELHQLIEDQEACGPTNREYWKSVEPPKPPAQQWNRVLAGLRSETTPKPARRFTRWIGTLTLLTTAATVMLAFGLANLEPTVVPQPEQPAPDSAEKNEAFDGVLQLALGSDIEIHSLPEEMASLLVTGTSPFGSELLRLAKADEIEFHGIGADSEGRFPEFAKEPNTNDPPVIWAPSAP